jgi:hypothetical protein
MSKEQIYFIGGWFGCLFGWMFSRLVDANIFLTFLFFLLCYFGGQYICSKVCKDDTKSNTDKITWENEDDDRGETKSN